MVDSSLGFATVSTKNPGDHNPQNHHTGSEPTNVNNNNSAAHRNDTIRPTSSAAASRRGAVGESQNKEHQSPHNDFPVGAVGDITRRIDDSDHPLHNETTEDKIIEQQARRSNNNNKREGIEMAIVSYLLPLLTGTFLMITCYGIGKYGYSVGWIGFFVALNFIKSKLWKQRERRVMALRQAAMREREVIMAQLQDLPAWVQFPDTERVEWINKVIHQLWPYIGAYTKTFVKELIEPQVKAQLPGPFKSFHFDEIDMGDIPMRVGGIKVYTENVGRDKIIMDMDVAYAGDCNFVVAVGAFKGGLNNMQFKGKLRCQLKPLIAYPPMVGGVTAYFLDDPTIDFNLTGLGEMVEIPGLMGAIRKVVTTQVRAIAVLPNEIVVPLTNETDVAALHFPVPDGVVRVGVCEAKDLENKDMSFIKKGKSDPYCHVSVGAQTFKTSTIDNDLSPKWNEYFEAVVDQASGQKLVVEVFDEDAGSNDEELGRLVLDLDMVRAKGITDSWYQLEGAKHGDLRLKLYWMNLTTSMADLNKEDWEKDWLNSKNPLHPAVLMVYVDSVCDLPYPKHNVEPSPFIEVRVGKEKQKTYPKPRTVNPLYQQKFIFFVNDPEHQDINVEAIDDNTKRSLGEFRLAINRVLREQKMELYQQTFSLTLAAHASPIVMTFRLRALKHGVGKSSGGGESSTKSNGSVGRATKGSGDHTTGNGRPPTGETAENVLRKRESGFNTAAAAAVTPAHNSVGSARDHQHHNSPHFTPSSGASSPRMKRSGSLMSTLSSAKKKSRRKPKDLLSQSSDGEADPYVKVKLLHEHSEKEERKTHVAMNTLNPDFNYTCEFGFHHSELPDHSLLIKVKDGASYGIFHSAPVLGTVTFPLSDFNKNETLTKWFDLVLEK